MQIKCENCGAAISAENIHEELAVGRCAHCNGLVDLARRRGDDGSSPRGRQRVPLPERFKLDEGPGRLTVGWRWFSFVHLFLVFFCLAWDSFLVVWYSVALGRLGVAEAMPANLLMVVFPLGHVAVGVGLTYYTLAGLLNRTTVEVSGGALRIRHAPLPWKGNRLIPGHEISQLFCEEKQSRGKNGSVHRAYHLQAVVGHERRRISLLSLEEPAQALYLEQRLEEELGIVDRAVPGELKAG